MQGPRGITFLKCWKKSKILKKKAAERECCCSSCGWRRRDRDSNPRFFYPTIRIRLKITNTWLLVVYNFIFTAFLLLFVPILSRNKTIKITDFQSVISVYPDVSYIQNVDLLVFSKSEEFFPKMVKEKILYILQPTTCMWFSPTYFYKKLLQIFVAKIHVFLIQITKNQKNEKKFRLTNQALEVLKTPEVKLQLVLFFEKKNFFLNLCNSFPTRQTRQTRQCCKSTKCELRQARQKQDNNWKNKT